jgi:hypothetical protein
MERIHVTPEGKLYDLFHWINGVFIGSDYSVDLLQWTASPREVKQLRTQFESIEGLSSVGTEPLKTIKIGIFASQQQNK